MLDLNAIEASLSRDIYPVRKKLEVKVGNIIIGGDNPIVIQSMTSGSRTNPEDPKTVAVDELKEIKELAAEGSELVRIALNSEAAAMALPYIAEDLKKNNINVPIVGCGQYEIEELVKKYPSHIQLLSKLRINPGNIGFGDKRDRKFEAVIEFCAKHNIPVRIGVNWGSLDKDLAQALMDENALLANPLTSEAVLRKALVLSALLSAKKAEEIGLPANRIVVSCKVSKVEDLVSVYRCINQHSDYALHLGLTEAGMGVRSIIATTAGLSVLIKEGIGDTIRASITPKVGENRSNEVKVCKDILQSLGLRYFAPQITSCPGCGRTNGNYFQSLTEEVDKYVASKMPIWCVKYKGVENLKISVMGCIVNGPGESKHANIGISLPGYGESPIAAVFIDGIMYKRLKGDNISAEFETIIDNYVQEKYPAFI